MLQETIRQWIYPKELRITAPREGFSAALNELKSMLLATRPSPAAAGRQPDPEGGAAVDAAALAQIGTHLWRLKNKMVEPGSKRPREEFSRAYRHLDAAWDVLFEAGVEVLDLTGRPFDHGQSLRPLAFQPVPGLQRRMIMETISPSILLRGKVIQSGEVIVGVPENHAKEQE
jgi:hypothetical protein